MLRRFIRFGELAEFSSAPFGKNFIIEGASLCLNDYEW